MSALQLYERGALFADGQLLVECQTITVNHDPKLNVINTMQKGFAGVSPGSEEATIDVASAMPRAGVEYDAIAAMQDIEIVEMVLFAAAKLQVTRASYQGRASLGADRSAEFSFSLIAAPVEVSGSLMPLPSKPSAIPSDIDPLKVPPGNWSSVSSAAAYSRTPSWDYPRYDDTGLSVAKVHVRLLTVTEQDKALANARLYVERLLASSKKDQALDWRPDELEHNARITEVLATACREPDDPSKPFFPGGVLEMREHCTRRNSASSPTSTPSSPATTLDSVT